MFLSIIIPAYNEEERIGPTLSSIHKYIEMKRMECEVILVDDGSSDQTVLEAQKSGLFMAKGLKIIKNITNKGKGFAVREGIKNSIGEYVLFSDADLSTPIQELDKLLTFMGGGFDIAIGSRSVKGASVIVHQPWLRERMGKIFNFFISAFLMADFKDTQCGFKLFKGPIARELASKLRIDGFSFDVEMIYLAKKKGLQIKEAGVVWRNSPQSKVKILGSSLSMFLDIFKIKTYHRCVQ